MKTDIGFPRFQDSYFCDSGEQIVVRGDDFEQFKKDVEEAKSFFAPKAPAKTATEANLGHVAPVTPAAKVCSVHGVQMISSISKKSGKPYSYHDTAEGRCFGKGVMPPMETGRTY